MIAHTKFSINYGIKSPEEVVNWGIQQQFPFLILADINTTAGVLSGKKYAQEKNFNLWAGADIRNKMKQQFIVVAKNNRGFHELNAFLSEYLLTNQEFPAKAPYFPNCLVIYPLHAIPEKLQENEFIGVPPHATHQLSQISAIFLKKIIPFPIMTFETQKEYNMHRLLRAIDQNILLSQLSPEQHAPKTEKLWTLQAIQTQFKQYPNAFQFVFKLFEHTDFQFQFGEKAISQNLSTYTGTRKGDLIYLQQLCQKGKKVRYPQLNFTHSSAEKVMAINQRIAHEIEVIAQKEYLAYFLITWDIVHYAKSQQFVHVGRGSGANSLVAYLLGITDVDPLELDLYFERFINIYRKNPPDFDLDFSWRERDKILHYIFKRFPNTALICTYNTYNYRNGIREIGKVLGLPKSEIDQLTIKKTISSTTDKIHRLVLKYAELIQHHPSHLSIHAGGVIIAALPISWYGSLFLPPKGFPTVQFSMLESEDVGFYKFDILSQRGLSKITDCLSIIKNQKATKDLPNIHDISLFKRDKKIQQLLQKGETIGCFYVESPAMRMLLQKLKTTTYLELVAASSIIRPGVSSSGMMQEYIRRHKDKKLRQKAHPLLLKIMPETYGIMVYQEDVIKVAHYFAGLSLGEADILRRGMSGKYRSRNEFKKIEQQFFENCKRLNRDEAITQLVWHQIESFAGYSFSKGHSASYAVESFQSLYLKAHFPLAYMVAVINNFGGYYRTEIYVREAQRLGAKIEPPCIQNSQWETRLENQTIYLGFQHIVGIDSKEIRKILQFRVQNGKFKSIEIFFSRLHLPFETFLLLVQIGAFRSLFLDKQQLKWKVLMHAKKSHSTKNELFPTALPSYQFPELEKEQHEQSFAEMELLGFPLCNPFSLLKDKISSTVLAKNMKKYVGKTIPMHGYYIAVKNSRTKHHKMIQFGTFMDLKGDYFDTVHFPPIVQNHPFRGIGVYHLIGKVSVEFGYYTLEVTAMNRCVFLNEVGKYSLSTR